MTTAFKSLPLCATLVYAGAASGYDNFAVDEGMRECYGKAMIGYDTVINARLGLPPEHALALARITAEPPVDYRDYLDDTLIVMWGAYLWDGSPHNYALSVFYRCARDQDRTTSAAAIQ